MLVNYYYFCIRKFLKNLKPPELEIYLRKKTRTKRVFLTV
ncbi:hypothetical protein LMG28690_03207 [Paraburkholderia caffeinilytica]|nr:hypothetical protein LMG28690_03207 [Paraburkholderia caffeinilytica]